MYVRDTEREIPNRLQWISFLKHIMPVTEPGVLLQAEHIVATHVSRLEKATARRRVAVFNDIALDELKRGNPMVATQYIRRMAQMPLGCLYVFGPMCPDTATILRIGDVDLVCTLGVNEKGILISLSSPSRKLPSLGHAFMSLVAKDDITDVKRWASLRPVHAGQSPLTAHIPAGETILSYTNGGVVLVLFTLK